ncbi:MAG TPA: hypothetical protein VMS00_06120 [Acidimicrobiales bacterium]|nr:hypothetical protein [Acidimicrobiales bacterium]
MKRSWLPVTSVLAIGVLSGTSLAACGGGPSKTGVATASTTTTPSSSSGGGTQATALLAYTSCMRSHGITNFPDPVGNGGIPKDAVIRAFDAVSNSQAEAAQNVCRHLLPPGGSLSGRPVQPVTAQQQQDYLKTATCMRSHGIINFPDPTFSEGSVNLRLPSSIDTHSTQFTQAQKICQKLVPSGLPYSGSGG